MGTTWLVDEAWPVAAQLTADGPMTLLAWPWPDDGAGSGADRVVVADGVGLVCGSAGQVVWARRDDGATARIEPGLVLAAADPELAWFVERIQIDPGEPPSPPPALPPGRIVAVGRDGSSHEVRTSAPATAVAVRGAEVWVTLAEPPVARSGGRPGSWRFGYPSSVLRATRDRLLVDGLASAVPASGEIPVGAPSPRPLSWLAGTPEWTRQHGIGTGRLMWDVGAPTGVDKINRRAVAIGYDPDGTRPPVEVDLGPGLVRDARAVGDELWVVVARRRFLAVPHDRGVDVVAVSPSGASRTVYVADSLDVSGSAPPLQRPSEERIHDHIEQVRRTFDDLENFWRSADGALSPLSEGLSDAAVTVVGDWPTASVVVTLRHPRRPGLLLRRTLPLFDEQGAPVERQYADIHLMEDLDTDYLAPADEAVDGVLDT